MRFRILIAFCAFVSTFLSSSLSAHHSYSATYDMDETLQIVGTVGNVQWRNPHAWFEFDVARAGGASVHWEVELSPPACLMRDGHQRDFLKPGDVLTLEISRAKDSSNTGYARHIGFSDGREIDLPVYVWMSDCSEE